MVVLYRGSGAFVLFGVYYYCIVWEVVGEFYADEDHGRRTGPGRAVELLGGTLVSVLDFFRLLLDLLVGFSSGEGRSVHFLALSLFFFLWGSGVAFLVSV